MSNAAATSGQRWFQFRLGSLFWAVLLLALAVTLFSQHRENRALEAENRALRQQVKARERQAQHLEQIYRSRRVWDAPNRGTNAPRI